MMDTQQIKAWIEAGLPDATVEVSATAGISRR